MLISLGLYTLITFIAACIYLVLRGPKQGTLWRSIVIYIGSQIVYIILRFAAHLTRKSEIPDPYFLVDTSKIIVAIIIYCFLATLLLSLLSLIIKFYYSVRKRRD